uniref:Uncharacterized protein n=1 Tax=Thermodesulfobacterium geofontis TaxID=1295609 RepID=A0A7V6CE09_9BACT
MASEKEKLILAKIENLEKQIDILEQKIKDCIVYPIWEKVAQYIECLLKQVKLSDLLKIETEKDKKKFVDQLTATCL